jgi:hypothetical protein
MGATVVLSALSLEAHAQTVPVASPLTETLDGTASSPSPAEPEQMEPSAQDLALPSSTVSIESEAPAQAVTLNTGFELSPEISTDIVGQTAPPETELVGQPPSLQTQPITPGQLPFEPKKELLQRSVRYSPSITLLTPSAYGKSWRQFSVGGSFQSRVRYRTESDALLGFGFGLGDSLKAVGLDVNVAINDVSEFKRGAVGFKLHRRLPDQWAIAVGVNNALTWGKSIGGISPYGVVTKGFQLRDDVRTPFSQIYVSAGAGTGRYRTEDDILNDQNSVGVFGSVAVRVIEQVNFITEWSGQDLSLGFSVLPFQRVPIVFTPLVTDVTGTAGDGPRFAFSVGLGFTF